MSFTQNNHNQISQLETIQNSEQINQFPKKDSTDDDETINSYNESENQFKKLQINTAYQKEVTIPSNKSSFYDGLNDFKKSPTKKTQENIKQSGLNTLKSLPLYAKYVIFYEEERSSLNYDTQTIEIKLELPHECLVNDCITESLAMFNEKLESMNQHQLPLDTVSNYQLYMAKGNGQRKPDYPPFDREQVLVNTHVQKFNLHLVSFLSIAEKSLNVVDYIDINNANNSFSSSNMIYRDNKSSSAQTTQTIPLSNQKINETLDSQLLPPDSENQQKGGFFQKLCCVCFPLSKNKNNNSSIQQQSSLQN